MASMPCNYLVDYFFAYGLAKCDKINCNAYDKIYEATKWKPTLHKKYYHTIAKGSTSHYYSVAQISLTNLKSSLGTPHITP
jgi:hypothetical protein